MAEVLEVMGDPDERQVHPLPTPTPTARTMPSDVAPEAWANVEALLITLSSNVRIQMDELRTRIEKLDNTSTETMKSVQSGIASLESTMTEFRNLLEEATIEVPEADVKDNEEQKDAKKNGHAGYLKGR